ncbi:NAD(P)-binding domain-containing protein [soil metagenome]
MDEQTQTTEVSMKDIGVIGLGAMGLPIARRLVDSGYNVHGCDLQAGPREILTSAGGSAVEHASELPPECSVYFVLMANPIITNAVMFGEGGLESGLSEGDVVVNLGTIGPDAVIELGKSLEPMGVQVLDSPMGKSSDAAAEGTLSLMVAGDKETFTALEPVLERIATDITFCGELGVASTIKIVNNLVSGAILEAVAEGLVLGSKAGATLEVMVEALSKTGADSWHLRNTIAQRVSKRDFKAGFSVDLATKDIKIGMDMASKRQVPLPVIGQTHQCFVTAQAADMGSEDWGALVKVAEGQAGKQLE